MAGGAAKAMVGHGDRTVCEGGGVDVPEELGLSVTPLHTELLVEVTVEDVALPADAQGIAAHKTLDGTWIEGVAQEVHVGVQFAAVLEPAIEAGDGHIGDAEELVKFDTEVLLQLAFVVSLQLCLVTGEEIAIGIVNQIQPQPDGAPVSEGVELL